MMEFLRDIFNLLFLLPSLKDRRQPKCKSHSSRAAAYDLLVEMQPMHLINGTTGLMRMCVQNAGLLA
ncbi:hypothetical protein A6R68_18814 [Neotoma lepida]|uniref:Uncharacterized protein n=1 Tax=Neotoma lepida TaxID=56216 RepID=A0A1A6HLG4_NEOLE|nr:hypothetical protein A6R68_18814 [Neotoma lepida]